MRRPWAVGEYLVRLYILRREGRPVVRTHLARWLGVSPPAVTQALRRMERDGLITQRRGGEVDLTEKGRREAETLLRRHYLVEHLLVSLLGLSWAAVHQEAEALEHALSPDLEARLMTVLGRPTACPHGNPFPGAPDEQERLFSPPLSEAPQGAQVRVVRITEEAEEEKELMEALWAHRLVPGEVFTVERRDSEQGLLLRQGERTLSLSLQDAGKVRVSVSSGPSGR